MQCPRDHTPLREVSRRDTTFDVCDACNGRWLDQGELEQLALRATKVHATRAAVARSMEVLERATFFHEIEGDPRIDCPRCGTRMKKVKFASGGAELTADRCETCHGFWLDAGEHGALFVLLERNLPIRPAVAIVALLLLALAVAIAWLSRG